MNQIILFLLFSLAIFSSQAQNNVAEKKNNHKKERTIDLWGHVQDSFTKGGVLGAKITLMKPDSTVIDTMTVGCFDTNVSKIDTYYKFVIPALPQKFIIKAEHPNYHPTYINFDLKYVARNTYFDAPWHFMKKRMRRMDQEEHQLNEVVVKATKIKIVYKGDTVVYNADAFNLSKGSMLDDLVKQMPGVELKDNGEIYQNGKKVDYLMLNGKQFFKGKNNVMLENLPYYTVKNVQFYNRTTDKSTYLGRDAEPKEFVMDVNLKKEYSTGYVVNAEVASGTKDRYLSRLFGLRYTDNTRISVYGNMNNVNEYRRPGRDGDWTPSDNTQGLMDYKSGGIDVSLDDKDKRYEDNLSGTVSANNGYYAGKNSSESFLPSGNSFARMESDSRNKNISVYGSNYFTLKIPLYAQMNTSFQYEKFDSNNQSRFSTFNANPAKFGNINQILDSVFSSSFSPDLKSIVVNRQSNQSLWSGHNINVNNSVEVSKKLSWGDNVEFSSQINYYNTNYSSFEASQLSYLQSNAANDSRNGYRTTPNKGYTYNLRGEYTLHMLSKWSYVFYYIYSKKYSSHVSSLYRLDWLDGWGRDSGHSLGELPSTRDSLLLALNTSNSFNRRNTENAHQQGFRIYYEKTEKGKSIWFNLHLPLKYKNEQMHYLRNRLDTTTYLRNWLVLPDMTFILRTNNANRQYQVRYNTDINTPDMERMIDIRDDANPLFISLGNPNLKNTIRHNINLYFSNQKPEQQRFISVNAGAWMVKRQIANGFTYNAESGVRTYRPENVDGNWAVDFGIRYGSAIDKEKHWNWETATGCSYNRNVDLTAVSGSTQSSLSKVNNLRVEEDLSLNYQKDALKLGVIGKLRWSNATSRRENFQTINACDFNYGMTAEYKLFKAVEFASDIKMYSRRGYSDSFMNTNNLIWNASIGHTFLNGKLVTRLEGFDLLHQLSNVQYYVNGQGKTEIWNNSIPSYVMLHLGYRLSVNPKKK